MQNRSKSRKNHSTSHTQIEQTHTNTYQNRSNKNQTKNIKKQQPAEIQKRKHAKTHALAKIIDSKENY